MFLTKLRSDLRDIVAFERSEARVVDASQNHVDFWLHSDSYWTVQWWFICWPVAQGLIHTGSKDAYLAQNIPSRAHV